MKKVETFRQEIQCTNGKKVFLVNTDWRFTDEEKEELRRILGNVKPKDGDIGPFLKNLEFLCDLKKRLLKTPPKSDLRLTREKVLTDCKAALGHLKQITKAPLFALWAHDTLKGYGTGTMEHIVCDLLVSELESAWEAVGPLEHFIKLLETHHQAENKKRGRKKADSDAFIKMLAEIYAEHIGKPSAYEEGPFFTIVRTVLEILDLPFMYPDRAIREALSHR